MRNKERPPFAFLAQGFAALGLKRERHFSLAPQAFLGLPLREGQKAEKE